MDSDKEHKTWSNLDHEGSLKRYSNIGAEIIVGAMRTLKRSPPAYRFPLLEKQRIECKKLLSDLQSARKEDSFEHISKIHRCFWMILTESVEESRISKFACPISCYLAVYGLRPDGTFKNAHECTQVLAIMKYLIRSAVLFEAYSRANCDTSGVCM